MSSQETTGPSPEPDTTQPCIDADGNIVIPPEEQKKRKFRLWLGAALTFFIMWPTAAISMWVYYPEFEQLTPTVCAIVGMQFGVIFIFIFLLAASLYYNWKNEKLIEEAGGRAKA